MPRYGALARDSAAALAGFGALSCEIVWTRRLGLVLGNEFAATYGVVAAFFVSLAVGSLLARK